MTCLSQGHWPAQWLLLVTTGYLLALVTLLPPVTCVGTGYLSLAGVTCWHSPSCGCRCSSWGPRSFGGMGPRMVFVTLCPGCFWTMAPQQCVQRSMNMSVGSLRWIAPEQMRALDSRSPSQCLRGRERDPKRLLGLPARPAASADLVFWDEFPGSQAWRGRNLVLFPSRYRQGW